MKQKRTMGIGQTICLLLLLVLLGVSMFLPVFRFNRSAIGSAMNKTFDYMFGHMDKSGLEQVYDKEEMENAKEEAKAEIPEMSEDFEETMKELEKNNGVKLRQISAFRIMTNSYGKLIYGKNLTVEIKNNIKEDDMFSKIDSKYNTLRIILWIIYILAFVILIVTILGAILHWTKFVIAGITTIYGLAAVAVFAYLRFGLMNSIVKAMSKNTDFLDDLGMSDLVEFSVNIASILKKMLPSFYSIGFLADFILAILLVVTSVIILLTGNRRKAVADNWDGMSTNDFNPFGAAGVFPDSGSGASFGMTSVSDQPIMPDTAGFSPSTPDMDLTATPTAPLSSMTSSSVAAAVSVASPAATPMPAVSAPVGQVKCTLGSAVGQGFRLPADRKVVIGKSPQNANLVINHPNVSNIHCSVRYNASNNSYIVKDHSMNGTFVNGVRLQKEVPMAYPAGTVLSLADGTNQVTLG